MITVLTGNNSFLRGKKLTQLKGAFSEKYGKENIERVAGEDLEVAQLPSLLQGGTLFSSNRMVIIRDLSKNKETSEKFIEYLEKVPEEVSVVLIEGQLDKRTSLYKTLKKSTDFQECIEPSDNDLLKWVTEYTKEQGGEIDQTTARKLIEYVGVDQQRLVGEVEKLVAFNPKVTSSSVEELVEKRPQSTAFQLLDLVLSDQKEKALGVLDNLERAFEDPYQIANLLIWQVQVLAVVKSAGSRPDSEIARETKLNPYVISKTKSLARRIDTQKLNKIIELSTQLDIDLKSTNAKPWRLVEHTILAI
jgi:DNA polymerase-3 subunit delta